MRRYNVTWTVPVRGGGFQEWGRTIEVPENWRDRLRLWRRARRRGRAAARVECERRLEQAKLDIEFWRDSYRSMKRRAQ